MLIEKRYNSKALKIRSEWPKNVGEEIRGLRREERFQERRICLKGKMQSRTLMQEL